MERLDGDVCVDDLISDGKGLCFYKETKSFGIVQVWKRICVFLKGFVL